MSQNHIGEIIQFKVDGRRHFAQATHFIPREGHLIRFLSVYSTKDVLINCDEVSQSSCVALAFFPLRKALKLDLCRVVSSCPVRQEWLEIPNFHGFEGGDRNIDSIFQTQGNDWTGSLDSSLTGRLPRRRTITDVYLHAIFAGAFASYSQIFHLID